MKRKSPWTVGDYAVRPGGAPNSCAYCKAEYGTEHKEDCELRQRTVVVRFNVTMAVAVPEHWHPSLITFKYNESSWCSSNLVHLLTELEDRMDDEGSCLCHLGGAEYVREATEGDEEANALYVENLPS